MRISTLYRCTGRRFSDAHGTTTYVAVSKSTLRGHFRKKKINSPKARFIHKIWDHQPCKIFYIQTGWQTSRCGSFSVRYTTRVVLLYMHIVFITDKETYNHAKSWQNLWSDLIAKNKSDNYFISTEAVLYRRMSYGYYIWATTRQNVSSGVSDQARHRPACAATEAS